LTDALVADDLGERLDRSGGDVDFEHEESKTQRGCRPPAPTASNPAPNAEPEKWYFSMVPADPRFRTLSQTGALPAAVAAIETLVDSGTDAQLNRINVLEFAEHRGLDPNDALDAFLHAAKLGLFEMAWNVCCPGCGGVLDGSATLRSVVKDKYPCALCASAHEPTLDQLVEVVFSVSPAVRRIAGHTPDSLAPWDYYRQMYFGTALKLPEGAEWSAMTRSFTLETEELAPGERAVLALQLPPEFLIVFDPITHSANFLDVKGEPTTERQEIRIAFVNAGPVHTSHPLRPGSLRLVLENGTNRRILPGVFRANDEFHRLFAERRPALTAKHLLTSQTFRELFKTNTLDVDQRLKLGSLTVLFTDLKGSTELYERVGDLAAYDVVRKHFRVLTEVVRTHEGAVVKTIGDALMATFRRPEDGVHAALAMHAAMERFNSEQQSEELMVKIGLHDGPCLAVTLNERLDYFGQTVNIAARVQGIAGTDGVLTTEPVILREGVKRILDERRIVPKSYMRELKGISGALTVYEIPARAG
jgi:class 3 adenylate cyclase